MGFHIFFSLILLAHNFQTFTECRFQTRDTLDRLKKSKAADDAREATHTEAVHDCNRTIYREEIYINCSRKGYDHVPDLPKESFAIDLSSNNIERIPDKQFTGLTKLHLLDLSDNPVGFIDVNAFDGLYKLSQLYLRRCKLFTFDVYNIDEMVSKLPALVMLSLTLQEEQSAKRTNITRCHCPDGTSANRHQQSGGLTRLSHLEIDAKFLTRIYSSATDFWELKELNLWITTHCFYNFFEKTCFQKMPSLKKLTINYVDLYPILIMPFQYKVVSFANNTFEYLNSLESLLIEQTDRMSDFPWFTKDFSMTDHFKNITTSVSQLNKFKWLSLRGIGYGLDPSFSFKIALSPCTLSSTIESLDISRNALIGRIDDISYFQVPFKNIIAQHNCLSYLFVSFQLGNIWTSVHTLDAGDQNYCIGETHTKANFPNNLHVKENSFNKLERFRFTNSFYKIPLSELRFFSGIKHLDLSLNSNSNNDKTLKQDSFKQFSALQFVDLSEYGFENVEDDALIHNKLQFLNLTSNSLGKMGCALSKRFKHLPSLLDLRLSDNKIQCLQKDTFAGLKAIQTIDLSKNGLESFQIGLENLTNIRMLNLSNNNIRGFTKATMVDLDALPNALVDLGKNTLTCNCESLDFLQWLQQKRNMFLDLDYYICTFNNNSFVYLENLQQIINELDRSCASHITLIIAVCLMLAFTLAFVLGGVVYRYRWKLRYLYYMTKLQIKGSEKREEYEQLFDFDAFISYASDDFEVARMDAMEYLEDTKGFRLCIHERDFAPGESISYNISKGIHSSKRTFLFFSKSFLQSDWCSYELNIARMESMYQKRDVILVVMLENIPKDEMTIDMIDFLKSYTYLEYPTTTRQEDKDVFWNKCADFIDEH